MIAVMATFAGFPASTTWGVFGFQVFVEASCDERRHIKRLPDVGATAANESRPVQRPDCLAIGARPASLGDLAGFEGAELGHFDQQGESGDAARRREC